MEVIIEPQQVGGKDSAKEHQNVERVRKNLLRSNYKTQTIPKCTKGTAFSHFIDQRTVLKAKDPSLPLKSLLRPVETSIKKRAKKGE